MQLDPLQAQPESGNLLAKLPNSVYALHYHPESNLLVAGQNYAGVHFLDWQQGKEIGSLQLTKSAIFDMQSYGKNLLIATGEGRLIKVDMESMAVLKSVQLADKSARTISISGRRCVVPAVSARCLPAPRNCIPRKPATTRRPRCA